MNFFSLARIRCVPGTVAAVAAAVESFFDVPRGGRLLGCWISEIGRLNEVTLLRHFGTRDELEAGQGALGDEASPIAASGSALEIVEESFTGFPGIPFHAAGKLGRFYEIRTYLLSGEAGALDRTIEAWQIAVPRRTDLSPLAVVMSALDGAPRIVHIWPFRSLDERQEVRADSVRKGVWPPMGTLPWISSAENALYVPTTFSPLG